MKKQKKEKVLFWFSLWFGAILVWVIQIYALSIAQAVQLPVNVIYGLCFFLLGILALTASRQIKGTIHGFFVFLASVILAILAIFFNFLRLDDFFANFITVLFISETTAYCLVKFHLPRYLTETKWFKRKAIEISGVFLIICGGAICFVKDDWYGWSFFLIFVGSFFLLYAIYFSYKKDVRNIPSE